MKAISLGTPRSYPLPSCWFPVARRLRGRLAAGLGLFGLGLNLISPGNVAAATCVSVPSGLVSWWRAEANANDIAGGNNGTLQGGATLAAGKAGQAFSFNNVNASVQVPNAVSLNFTS